MDDCVSLGTDGLVDMKRICGIIVARKKDRPGREDKVSLVIHSCYIFVFVWFV